MTEDVISHFRLDNKSTIVTGSLGLIGSEVADALAQSGSNIGLLDNGNHDKIIAQAHKLEEIYDIEAVPLKVDITDAASVDNALDALENQLSPPDVLIHLAALNPTAATKKSKSWNDLISFEMKDWKHTLDVNLTGTFVICQKITERMIKNGGGHIILVASTYSLVGPNPGLYRGVSGGGRTKTKPPDYVATKSAIPNFTKYLATSFATDGIRANCVVPHGVDDGTHDQEFLSQFANLSPLGRMCDVKELRGPFIFLASDASSYMTGSTLVVDGGWTAW